MLTYGRSGSTLLQGILNSIPGYLIRGENREARLPPLPVPPDLREGGRTGRARGRQPAPGHPPVLRHRLLPCRGVPGQLLARPVTRTLLRPEPGTRVTGFKEIRWYQEDLAEFVGFLRAAFPGARFLVNTREHEAVLASKFWRSKPRDGRLERAEAAILYGRRGPGRRGLPRALRRLRRRSGRPLGYVRLAG